MVLSSEGTKSLSGSFPTFLCNPKATSQRNPTGNVARTFVWLQRGCSMG